MNFNAILIGRRSTESNFSSQCSLRLAENNHILLLLRHYGQNPKYKRSIATSRKFNYRCRSRNALTAITEETLYIINRQLHTIKLNYIQQFSHVYAHTGITK